MVPLRPGAAETAQLPGPTVAEGALGSAFGPPGLGETGSSRPQGPAGMRAPAPVPLRWAALGWLRRPPGTSLCAGPRAAASRHHPRPGKQAPGAGRGGEGPRPGRDVEASRGRRLGLGSPGPNEEPAPPSPPPAPLRSRSRGRRRRRCCSRCRFSATHRRDTRAGQPCRPAARLPALCPA